MTTLKPRINILSFILSLIISILAMVVIDSCVTAQTAQSAGINKSGKFEDKDIENFVPVFSVDLPKVPKTEYRDAGKLPEKNASERVKFLMDSISEANKRLKYMEGYRILVYSGNDKDEVNRVKENIYRVIPNADIYSIYKQPIYRVKLGDYTDRLEANRIVVTKLSRIYPNAIVVPDNIFIKRKY